MYGGRKMWHAIRREGWDSGRDRIARLMRQAGLCGTRVADHRSRRTQLIARICARI
ncbi:IS3 family transposase [Schaalia hyovaginalis]|uniref:IS3 family transposase n=1 Tax=Schaalia hyovaginalis TaxID=29316 RepID=UPI003CCE0BEE